MMIQNRSAIEAKLEEYEGLVIATTKKWRYAITYDLSDDDIKQELRLKVWRALNSFDPTKWNGSVTDIEKERRHVFGAVLNRVKDLMAKKKREEEILGEDCQEDRGKRPAAHKSPSPWIMENRDVCMDHHVLSGMTNEQKLILMFLNAGYSRVETMALLSFKESAFKRELVVISEHVKAYQASS